MITVPLSTLLILFIVFLFVFGIFFIINIYDLATTYAIDHNTLIATVVFILACALIIFYASRLLAPIDFSQEITIFNSRWFAGGTVAPGGNL